MRKKLYDIVDCANTRNKGGDIYDVMMIIVVALSMVPLAFKNEHKLLLVIEIATTAVFIVDYALRWITADVKLDRGWASFILYPFTPMAIIDLLSILPTFVLWSKALKVLKVVRLLRAMRVLKVFKSFRYSKNVAIIGRVFKKTKKSLFTVCVLAVGYIFISALVVFNVEPETFHTFFDAVYWATVSLTTVGYGDIYTVSTIGKAVTMISAVLGVAIVALPAGIVTAGYMGELQEQEDQVYNCRFLFCSGDNLYRAFLLPLVKEKEPRGRVWRSRRSGCRSRYLLPSLLS